MDFESTKDYIRMTEEMRKRWGKRITHPMKEDTTREYAVLLPILGSQGEPAVLLEERACSLKSQPGEICFPGGAIEPGETALEAAVREAQEELLINESDLEVLAPLDPLFTPVGVIIHPYLSRLLSYHDTYSKAEVARVFAVPLGWLLENEPDRHRTRVITVPGGDFPYDLVPGGKEYKWREGVYDVLFYQWKDRIIWGMTAKILHAFVEMYRAELGGARTGMSSETARDGRSS